MWKKHQTMLFVKNLTKFVRIEKATELKISFNPSEEEFDYISSENPSTELDKYAPTITGLPLTMYEGEPDFDMIWEYAYNLKTGSDAITDALIVYPKKSGEGYEAWSFKTLITIQEMDAVAKTITFDAKPSGDIIKGVVTIVDGEPVFTPKTEELI